MKAPLLLAAVAAGLLAGCATNPFAQFYQSYTNRWPAAMQQRLLPPSSEPRLISSSNLKEDGQRLNEQGLVAIGFAGFRGGLASQQQLKEQARKVGADAVLYSSNFSHTEEGVIPWTSYQPGQTYTTQTYGTAYGSGAYSGYSTTTTPGTYSTQYIPYQRHVFDQGAVFWRHMKTGTFGAQFTPIPDDLRTKLQRNTGVFVAAVVDDSPAFKANVMRGDVIVEIAGKPLATVQELMDFLESHAGQRTGFTVLRDARTIEIQVHLNDAP